MNDRPEWFAPKRYGYGAGWPIAWQGWAILAIFLVALIGVGTAMEEKPGLQAAIISPLIASLLIITARTTRGGWRWRWGDPD